MTEKNPVAYNLFDTALNGTVLFITYRKYFT